MSASRTSELAKSAAAPATVPARPDCELAKVVEQLRSPSFLRADRFDIAYELERFADRLSAQAQPSGAIKVTTIRQLVDDPNSASGKSLREVPVTHPSVGPAVREAARIAEAMKDGGFWKSCCGCHELNDGAPTGPYDKTLQCHVGNGCSECGGIGAVWDDGNYPEVDPETLEVLITPNVRSLLKEIYDHITDPNIGTKETYPVFGLNFGKIVERLARALTTPDPQGPSEKKDDVQTRPQNEESRVADTSCTKSASKHGNDK